MRPRVTSIRLPAGYGSAEHMLQWADVSHRLAEAAHYWLATTRPDGRPHVVPVDGIWLDDVWYFGGHPDTIHQRNLRSNQEIAVHLPDPIKAVIVEGRAEHRVPTPELADRLAAASRAKYGYAPRPDAYQQGVWGVAPRRVLAWDNLAADPTRFTFPATDVDGSAATSG